MLISLYTERTFNFLFFIINLVRSSPIQKSPQTAPGRVIITMQKFQWSMKCEWLVSIHDRPIVSVVNNCHNGNSILHPSNTKSSPLGQQRRWRRGENLHALVFSRWTVFWIRIFFDKIQSIIMQIRFREHICEKLWRSCREVSVRENIQVCWGQSKYSD